jgi:uncharacterized protein (TIGR03435 family)
MRLLTTTLSALLAVARLLTAGQPAFETASVRRADRCVGKTSVDPAMVTLNGVPLKLVLMSAFKVRPDDISGPSWLDTEYFEIIGKFPTSATRDQLPEMLQSLLAERFKLTAHKETRSRSGFDLVLDKNGPKLKATDSNDPVAAAHAGQVSFGFAPGREVIRGSMTLATFTRLLSNRLKAPIQDLTGITGKYDIDLTWTPDVAPQDSSDAVSLPAAPAVDVFTAVRSSLGLKLEPRRQQIEILVIDRIERSPTEN